MRASLALVLAASPAWAYTVGTAYTAPCHEDLTAAAFSRAAMRRPATLPELSGVTRALMEQFHATFGDAQPRDELERWVFLSVVLGVRSPDGESLSPTDFVGTRPVQLAPAVQYAHALRRADDDGAEGDVAALAGARAELRRLLDGSRDSLARPAADQVLTVTTWVEEYGSLEVEVWAPAYFAGRAAHLLQDSFSHSLRSEDLRRVRHVFNFVDALSSGFEEQRDGERHSNTLDACDESNRPLTDAATNATVELLNESLGSTPAGATLRFLEHEPGCGAENGYCDSAWLPLARQRQSHPVLGCSTAGGMWSALMLVCLWRRAPRRRRPPIGRT